MITKDEAKQVNIIDKSSKLAEDKEYIITQIKNIGPNLVNSDNILDIKALQDLLGVEKTTSNNQGYELTFAGKGLAKAKASTDSKKELKIEEKQSKDFDNTENVIIRGDNIEVLKILYKNYFEKIKMIYIDPPYNTQKENFIYNDNFKQNEDGLIKEFGLNDDSIKFLHNIYGTKSHSGWLSFMYPRLKLAKELLVNDGVIFISIDDNEQANLKLLCDEIFGEENCIANIIWNNKYTLQNDAKHISSQSEHLLLYTKNKNSFIAGKQLRTDKQNEDYKNPDNDPNGRWKATPIHAKSGSSSNLYSITFCNSIEWNTPKGRYPRYSKERLLELYNNNELYFNKNKGVDKKTYLKDVINKGVVFSSFWSYEKAGHTHGNNEELSLLVGKGVFDNPKGTKLLKECIRLANTSKNDIILDFFAGSGTTGDAVMKLNAEDGGNRKFILAQIDEEIDPKKSKEAYDFCTENNFEPVISSITIERINRAGEKIKKESEDKKDMFSSDKNLDIGYKVFSLTDIPKVNYQDRQYKLLNMREGHLNTLYNMLIATCKPLNTKIELIKEKAIYKADNEIYILDNITKQKIEKYNDLKINIDAFSNIDLESFLNLGIIDKENINIIY